MAIDIMSKAREFASNGVYGRDEMLATIIDFQKKADNPEARRQFQEIRRDADLWEKTSPNARALYRQVSDALRAGYFDATIGDQVKGVDHDTDERLESRGIMSPMDLLGRARTPDDRSGLANDLDVRLEKLNDVVERANLARVIGIGPVYGAVLERVGLRTMQDLAKADASDLRQRIVDFQATPEGRELFSRVPSKRALQSWIEKANLLPFMVFKLNQDQNRPFSVAALDTLDKYQQSTLMFGHDVKLADGRGVFYGTELKRADVRPDSSDVPREVRDTVNGIIANPPAHPYYDGRSAEAMLNGLQAIKSGDKTVGYVADFEVESDERGFSYEGVPVGAHGVDHEARPVDHESRPIEEPDLTSTFNLQVAFDRKGKELDRRAEDDWFY